MHIMRFEFRRWLLLLLGILLSVPILTKGDDMPMKSSGDQPASEMMEEDDVMTITMPSATTESSPEAEDDETPKASGEGAKKSVKNFTCQVTGALIAMANSIKELDNDIKAIKNQMFEKCPGFNDTARKDALDDIEDTLGSLNTTENETELEGGSKGDKSEPEGPTTTPLPPIPTDCDEPFQLVANSCYYILYYAADWKTWGDANAYCQTLGGTLAAPYRLNDLRSYLTENFSSVFWVGAKRSEKGGNNFEWLNGKEFKQEDWKEGQPSKSAARFCVYLESFSGYKAINHYCGEKFSFVCEKRPEMKEE